MIWNRGSTGLVFGEVFAGAEVEPAVDLPGVDADDFAVGGAGQIYGQGGLAGGGRTGDYQDFNFILHSFSGFMIRKLIDFHLKYRQIID